MSDKASSGRLFGIPYNFNRPTVRRLLSSYWQPGRGMVIEKPFGIGYTLNLANWRSWLVLVVAGLLFYRERSDEDGEQSSGDAGPVEVVVDD